MRLLLVSTDFPPDVGGTQTYAAELARRLHPRCERFAVVAPYVVGCDAVDALASYPVFRVRGSKHLFPFRAPFLISRLGMRSGYDAVYCVSWIAALSVVASFVVSDAISVVAPRAAPRAVSHAVPRAVSRAVSTRISAMMSTARSWPMPSVAPGSSAGLLRRHPILLTAAHGRELLFNPFSVVPILRSGYAYLRRLSLRMSTRVYAVSRFSRELLIQSGVDREKITLLPNGSNPLQFAPATTSSFRESIGATDRYVILTTGRLVPRKGIDIMLRAMPDVLSRIPHALYVIVGSGPERSRLQTIAQQLTLEENVLFVDEKAHEELPAWYNTCDIFVLPVRDFGVDVEGFGIVLLEASASQKPVIGTTAGGVPDAVIDGETGMLVPQNSSPALAGAVIKLFEDPDRAALMGDAGRQHVIRTANWDSVASKLHASILENVRTSRSCAHAAKTAPLPFSFFRF